MKIELTEEEAVNITTPLIQKLQACKQSKTQLTNNNESTNSNNSSSRIDPA